MIDVAIVKLFINGTDEDRATIKKLYPELNLESLRDEVFWMITKEAIQGERKTYHVNWKGRNRAFVFSLVEDDLT